MKFQKICVLGLGYIGLPTASTFATHGVKVLGVDINQHIIETLNKGEIHIHEPGLRDEVKKAIQSGNFKAATKPEEADAFLIAVPTPFQEDKFGEYNGMKYKLADMRAVISAAEAIVPFLRKGNLVVLESTSPPRTTVDLVTPILERSGLKAGRDFHLAYSPERVLPGQILRELIENARVIGGVTPESAQAGQRSVCHLCQRTDHRNRCDHRRDGQIDGEYLPRCEHCHCKRILAPRRKIRRGCVGSHLALPTCIRVSTSSARVPASAVIASAWTHGSLWKPRQN